jgi:hypothetical protein
VQEQGDKQVESGNQDSMEHTQSAEEQERQRRAEIQLLEKKLSAKDAIMEPNLYSTVARYLQLTEKHPQEVVSALCKGYVGYAQLTHVVCDWLLLTDQDGERSMEGRSCDCVDFLLLLCNALD